MQFLTVRETKQALFHVRVQTGGRGWFFNKFEYEVSHDPTADGVSVGFAPDLGRSCPRDLWPEIEVGVRLGCEEARRLGTRLCMSRFTMLFALCHDVDTTPKAVHSRVAWCISEEFLRFTTPLEPFRPDWLTSDVIALAKGIHADSATDRYPILSDALRDAGCEDPLIHDHLQMCPDHGPSCWVVEMILAQTRTAGV